MLVSRSIAILVLVCGCTAPRVESAGADARIPVLIIGGVNNHDWARTTAAVRATLERTGRFTVATGEVTIGVPAAFPGPDEPSVVAPERLEWPL